MDARDYSQLSRDELIAALQKRDAEQQRLTQIERVAHAQHEIARSVATMEQAATGRLRLKSMLLEIMRVSSELLTAEECSIFLLDESEVVIESILARGATIRERKNTLIGQVLDRGLAGWVIRHRKPGKVDETATDERWIELRSQPYKVRSVLCVPLIKGKRVLGLLTLMHSRPKHFSSAAADLFVELLVPQISLALDNLRLSVELSEATAPIEDDADAMGFPVSALPDPENRERELSGVYILTANGQFLYANPRLAEIFGYEFHDLVALDSFFKLVEPKNIETIHRKVSACFQNQEPYFATEFTGSTRVGDTLEIAIEGNRTRFYGKSAIVGTLRPV
ncbi:MAG: GAF domain-containing protein [Geitlerinemataceae cyanobacterium]